MVGVVLVVVSQYLLANWLRRRMERSIRAEYDRQLSHFKHELLEDLGRDLAERRKEERGLDPEQILERASRVASFLAYVRASEDIRHPDFLKMAWELSLWLPAEICGMLRDCRYGLCSDEELKEVLLATRKFLLKGQAGALHPEEIPPFVNP